MNKGFFSGILSRHGAKLLIMVGILSTLWLGYAYLPIAKVASSSITLRDLRQLKSTTNTLLEISGLKDRMNMTMALQTLVVAGIEREILAKKSVTINKEAAVKLIVSESPFRGVLEQAKASVGDSRFYKILVEPRAVGETFQQYYNNSDTQRTVANGVLEAAKLGGLEAAATKAGSKPVTVNLPLTQETATLFAAARQSGIGRIVPSVIEDAGGFSILYLRDLNQQALAGEAVVVRRTPAGRFIIDEAKKAAVVASFPVYSPFSFSTLEKRGMIFSKQALGEEQSNEKK